MDRTHVEETKRQHRKKSSPVEPLKGIEADQRTPGEEESSKRWRKPASHGFIRSSSTGSCKVETVRWWPMLHIWSDKGLSQGSQSCAVWLASLVACWTEDTIQTLSAGLQGSMWSCTAVPCRLLSACVSCQWQRWTTIVHAQWPRRCPDWDRFQRTFFRRGCTTGMEPAARKDQESSVAAIV